MIGPSLGWIPHVSGVCASRWSVACLDVEGYAIVGDFSEIAGAMRRRWRKLEPVPALPEQVFSYSSVGSLGERRTSDFGEIADNPDAHTSVEPSPFESVPGPAYDPF